MSAAAADLLIRTFEEEKARALGRTWRRGAGAYYTPPPIAAQVVELLLRHANARGTVLDPCAGAGAFLVAAARAGLRDLHGFDLDASALRVARRALRLCGVRPALQKADSLRVRLREPADLLVSNPPYGHVGDERERAALLELFPALSGGEIDRYAAFLLRSLQLVRPGGAAALLVPDTWMFLARAGALRTAVLEAAEIAAIVDLGKPFAAAKDTRVQAVVLVKKPAGLKTTFVGRGEEKLAPVSRSELEAAATRGWFVYRTQAERRLCSAMEAASAPLGSVCEVGYGLRTGDNARHVARRAPRSFEVGLAGGEDVTPFALRWREKTLLDAAPLQALVDRQRGRPRVAIQRIRTNAQAPWARWLEAAPVPEELVCLDSLSTLACKDPELLWALLGLVSSVAMNRFHRLRTTDVNVKPSALRELPVPLALIESPHALATLARERSRAALGPIEAPREKKIFFPAGGSEGLAAGRIDALDRRIDAQVYALFGLPPPLVEACERGFWGNRFPEQREQLDQAMSDPPGSVARKEGTA